MSFDASQAFRYSMDFMLAQTSVLAVTPNSVYIVEVTNDQIGFNDTSAARITKETRVLIADGYRSYAAGDGYLNPIIEEPSGQSLVLSAGQLLNQTLQLGPIVFPYNWNNFAGGTDSNLFYPLVGSNKNVQIYVQIRGVGLALNSNFYDVDHMKIADMGGLSYYLMLNANSRAVT